jgi:hypothetical protein
MIKQIWVLFLFLSPSVAYAYVGPGMLGGAFLAVIGFVIAVFIALISILYYPLKRMLKRRKKKKEIKK